MSIFSSRRQLPALFLTFLTVSVILLTASVNADAALSKPVIKGMELKTEAKSPEGVVTFACVGDNLIHMPIIRYGIKENGFDFLFEHIRDYMAKADIAVINQETPLVEDPSQYSSYPRFGSPVGIADAVRDAGFSVVTCATNHTLDKGISGLFSTAGAFEKYKDELLLLGIHTSAADAARIPVLNFNGLRIAMLNYTYGTNGIPVPSQYPWCIDGFFNKERVIAQLKAARDAADAVIVFAHWGSEYQTVPDSFQQEWTQIFLDYGVDVVVGSHPHVVQPCSLLQSKSGHEMLVFYSLGNFVSCQNRPERLLGAMAVFTLQKQDAGGVRIAAYNIKPLVTVQAYPLVTTCFLSDYTDELANKQALYAPREKLQSLFDEITAAD